MKLKAILFFSLVLTSAFAHADSVSCQGKDVKVSTFTSTSECYQKYDCPEVTILEVTCKGQTLAISAEVPTEKYRAYNGDAANSADIQSLKYSLAAVGASSYQNSKMKGYLATILTAKSLNAQLTLKSERKKELVNGHPLLEGVTLD